MLLAWDQKYSVRVKQMDEHHQRLVELINELHDAMRSGKGKDIIASTLSNLIDYTKFHFSAEEKLMSTHNYPDYITQKLQHDQFVSKINGFQKELDAGKLSLSMEVMTFLKDWLIHHISGADKKYGPYLNEKGIK